MVIVSGAVPQEAWTLQGPGTQPRANTLKSIGALVDASLIRFENRLGGQAIIDRTKTSTLEQDLKRRYKAGPTDIVSAHFNTQTSLSFATVFLIAPDLIVCTGHSFWREQTVNQGGNLVKKQIPVVTEEQLKDRLVVFGWQVDPTGKEPDSFPQENVFRIQRVLKLSDHNNAGMPDFCIAQLAKNARGYPAATPLTFCANPALEATDLWTAGYPFGVPLKYVQHGSLVSYPETPEQQQSFLFNHSLSTNEGCSGAPILNGKNEVVGIHVRSNEAFAFSTITDPSVKGSTRRVLQEALRNPPRGVLKLPLDKTHEIDAMLPLAMRTDSIRLFASPSAGLMVGLVMRNAYPREHTMAYIEVSDMQGRPLGKSYMSTSRIVGVNCQSQRPRDGATSLANFSGIQLRVVDPASNGHPIPNVLIEGLWIAICYPRDTYHRVEFWYGLKGEQDISLPVGGRGQQIPFGPLMEPVVWSSDSWPPARTTNGVGALFMYGRTDVDR